MRFTNAGADVALMTRYVELFAACFPGAAHFDLPYLRWLYRDNPAGAVVGFDAWDGERLAAHYACVPASVRLGATPVRALLSLNTATHPDYQGKGLFTQLASRTYDAAATDGFGLVFGFANANSTPGFLRKLGFGLVAPLDAAVGVGRFRARDWQALGAAEFARSWPRDELAWRLRNPARPVRAVSLADGSTGFLAATGRPGLRAWAQLGRASVPGTDPPGFPAARIFIGKWPAAAGIRGMYLPIPQRLRPSPLNMIVRGLAGEVALDPANVSVSFLDFDAF